MEMLRFLAGWPAVKRWAAVLMVFGLVGLTPGRLVAADGLNVMASGGPVLVNFNANSIAIDDGHDGPDQRSFGLQGDLWISALKGTVSLGTRLAWMSFRPSGQGSLLVGPSLFLGLATPEFDGFPQVYVRAGAGAASGRIGAPDWYPNDPSSVIFVAAGLSFVAPDNWRWAGWGAYLEADGVGDIPSAFGTISLGVVRRIW
jgi:hypothetical protein